MKRLLTLFIAVLAFVGFSFGVIACEPVEGDGPMYDEPVERDGPMYDEPVDPVN